MRVLIVDDNDIKISSIQDIINCIGSNIEIKISKDTHSAKLNLMSEVYDILILDLNIPTFAEDECTEYAGIELFKEINRTDIYKKPKDIIIMTAYENLKEKYNEEVSSGLFSIIKYESSESEWKDKLKKRVQYIYSICDEVVNKNQLAKQKILFISHSSRDISYVKELVKILEFLGLKCKDSLFCSSIPGYDIPIRTNIYDYLREQFNKEVHVLCLLSSNYYSSPACMNEMGATWVMSKEHTAILVPEFEYSQIDGAIDASKIWFKLIEKSRMNSFKESLIQEFDLNEVDSNRWNDILDEFIGNVKSIYESNLNIERKEKVELEDIDEVNDGEIECTLRFINGSNEMKQCRNISIDIIDCKNKEISINITNSILRGYKFYKNENRIEKIILNKSDIDGINKFNIYQIEEIRVNDSWATCY